MDIEKHTRALFPFFILKRRIWPPVAPLSAESIWAKPICTMFSGGCGILSEDRGDGAGKSRTQRVSPKSSACLAIAAFRFLSSSSRAAWTAAPSI